jgi:phospho-N-acetylmuramoyl-pentapeptide-transferase
MLYHLLWQLHYHPSLSWLNVVRYTSTRIILATLSALIIGFLLSPWFIRKLQEKQIGQVIRDDGPQSHLKKAGTPTMGGSLIIFALVIPTLLWCDLRNGFVWLTLAVTVTYGLIGFLDDYLKIARANSKGLPGKLRLGVEALIAFGAVLYLFRSELWAPAIKFKLALPLADFSQFAPVLPMAVYVLLAIVVIVGAANAVNLTDGLDGLAIGPVIIAAATFLLLAYAAGTKIAGFNLAAYLRIPPLRGVGELAIFCGAMAGAGVVFLWYNTYPASVFMGDVGSLSLGGALGMLAVLTKNEFTLLIVGGIFVLEAVSVMVQVVSFQLTGRRVFLMAPLHHHFEKKGWAEPKVIVRFWIISIMLALIALATLKVR